MSSRDGLYGLLIFYNVSLIFVALYAYFANLRSVNKGVSWVKMHYVSGKELSSGVLFMTTFSTLYSGYAVVAVPAETASLGFTALRWCGAVICLLLGVLLLWPRLRPLSVSRGYYSPGHFIADRYNSRLLSFLMVFCLVIPQVIYLTVQIASLVLTVDAVTDGEIDGKYAAFVFSALILLYEILGGLKSVALTDVIVQSVMMIASFLLIGPTFGYLYGGFTGVVPENCSSMFIENGVERGCVAYERPTLLTSPTRSEANGILSFLILFLAFPLNPHMLQRCYSAASDAALRNTVLLMCFTAYLTMIPSILIGLTRVAVYPEVPGSTFGIMMAKLLDKGWFSYSVSSIAMTSSIAAIMSTADSVLIGATNCLSVELYKELLFKNASDYHVIIAGRLFSVTLMGIAVFWGLKEGLETGNMMDWQNAILCQCLPSFACGLYWSAASSRALIPGVLSGFAVLVLVEMGFIDQGVQTYTTSGVWGLTVNISVFLFFQVYLSPEFLDDTARKFDRVAEKSEFGSGEILHQSDIVKIMRGSKDPCSTRLGISAMIGGFVFVTLSVPYWGISSKLWLGLPIWAWVMIFFQVCSCICGLIATWAWIPGKIAFEKFPSFMESESQVSIGCPGSTQIDLQEDSVEYQLTDYSQSTHADELVS